MNAVALVFHYARAEIENKYEIIIIPLILKQSNNICRSRIKNTNKYFSHSNESYAQRPRQREFNRTFRVIYFFLI